MFLLGTDSLGRDLCSRLLYATRISLSVGLIGVAMSFFLGCVLGGVSGYYGGTIDVVVQRIIEFLLAIPTIPLWMGLAAALPHDWDPVKTYFAITVILSLINWTYLARVVRGKLLSSREEDFVTASLIGGATRRYVIFRHLLPSFMSYLIVSLTLAVPNMILGETALSFLGIGLQAPVVSWGVLLKDAQNIETVALYPWMMLPVFSVIVAVLSFNFLGDGLRDAADPYR
jgi:peptide/nickel transport system permease protein